MRFIETAFLVIHAGYEGGDIAENHHDPHESLKRTFVCLYFSSFF